MSSITEILELDIFKIENDELKLFVGDIEMLFSRLNAYADRGSTPDKIFYQCYGEVNTYLYCLNRLGVFTEDQVRTMKSVLAELERKQASRGYRQVKEHGYKYCPHCGEALN